MDLSEIPQVDLKLLLWLEARYPERSWEPGDDLDELKFLGGKRDLVRYLRLIFEEQTNPQPDEAPEGE